MSESGRADLKLEYLHTTGKSPLCSHATMGTFVVLRGIAVLDKQVFTHHPETNQVSRVTVSEDSYHGTNARVFMKRWIRLILKGVVSGHHCG